MQISFEIQSGNVEQILNRLQRQISNLRPAMQNIGQALASNIQLTLKDGVSPYGDTYAPLKELRHNNRDARISDVPLNDTRQHIYNKITSNVSENSVIIGLLDSSEKIGRVHQFGSYRKNIPARPFLPIRNDHADLPPAWEREVMDIITMHIQAAFE